MLNLVLLIGKKEAKEDSIKGPALSLTYELNNKHKSSFYANRESKESIFQRFNKQKSHKDEKASKKASTKYKTFNS